MIKKYERNLATLVTFHVLNSLNINFSYSYPKEISVKIKDLLNDLISYHDKDYPKDFDIISDKLIEVIEFKSSK